MNFFRHFFWGLKKELWHHSQSWTNDHLTATVHSLVKVTIMMSITWEGRTKRIKMVKKVRTCLLVTIFWSLFGAGISIYSQKADGAMAILLTFQPKPRLFFVLEVLELKSYFLIRQITTCFKLLNLCCTSVNLLRKIMQLKTSFWQGSIKESTSLKKLS